MSTKDGPLLAEKVLDHGFVELLDVLGTDQAVVNAARTSYDKGTKSVSSSDILIKYLMRHKHTGPFEFGECVFRIRCPIFVARQWFRHRTGSYNEVSLRYSEAVDEYYVPEPELITTQDSRNRQARTSHEVATSQQVHSQLEGDAKNLMTRYDEYIKQGVAREIARINLPLSLYTTFMFKMDLRNLLNFFTLRFDSHAQYEIRLYAEKMVKMVEKYFPMTMNAWRVYTRDAISFSSQECEILRTVISGNLDIELKVVDYLKKNAESIKIDKLEQLEFQDKILKLLGKPSTADFLGREEFIEKNKK